MELTGLKRKCLLKIERKKFEGCAYGHLSQSFKAKSLRTPNASIITVVKLFEISIYI